jgi:hypothetical protein
MDATVQITIDKQRVIQGTTFITDWVSVIHML